MSSSRLYADYAATAPLKASVRAAMEPWLGRGGNASSMHAEGRAARAAIDRAREQLSESVGCLFGEVLFTSGGTEAANMAILGAALASLSGEFGGRRRVLVGASEHHCVLAAAETAQTLGFQVELIPVDYEGVIDLSILESTLKDDVLMVSVMHANNELGTIQPISVIADMARKVGALFHTDAVQSFGRLPIHFPESGVDMLSVSAHKIGGPQGVGALVLKSGVKIKPLISGGGQEREMRAGTEPAAAIVGFGVAASEVDYSPCAATEAFWKQLDGSPIPWVRTVRETTPHLSSHAHMRFPGLSAESMLIALDRDGVSASSGAACSSGALEPSHVLLACGFSQSEANEGLRFTFGPEQPASEGTEVASRLIHVAQQVAGFAR